MKSFEEITKDQLDVLGTGSVILTQVIETGEHVNAAIKDRWGAWALGGHAIPWDSEKLAKGIAVAQAELIVLVAL